MDEKQKKEAKQKLKQLRRELEEKIKDIIPDALRSQTTAETFDDTVEQAVELDDLAVKRIIEALIFAASKPLTVKEMSKTMKSVKTSQVQKAVKELQEEYENESRSFRLNEIAGGYEFSTQPQYAMWIAKLEKEKKAKQASLAALETLAILAYKQPITRVEVEEIRGVDVSGVMSTLLERGFIAIVGRKEVPGRPLLYGTTELFLEHFGLKNLEDLPNISEIKALVEDTIRKEELLRKENLVSVAEPESGGYEMSDEKDALEEKFDEISEQIAGVKVKSEKAISEIIDPNEKDENKSKENNSQTGEDKTQESQKVNGDSNES